MDLIANRSEVSPAPSCLEANETPARWMLFRRKEIASLFEENFFGKIPPRPMQTEYMIHKETPVFNGLGIRRDAVLVFRNRGVEHRIKALWYLPATATASNPVPLIIGLNFMGNAGCSDEPDIELEEGETRGVQAHRWQIPFLLQSGFSLITAPRNQFFPDHAGGRAESIFRLFHSEEELTVEHRELTAISAWAWGYSRLLELGESDPRINRGEIWAHGHSRLGKTSLWVGANDLRFAGIVSNCSGCCGAALSRERLPEAEQYRSIKKFTWWFQSAFDLFNGRDDEMPFDMNWLCALTAPRPLLIASATEDFWADPFNEYRSAQAVGEVYRLFGAEGLPGTAKFPEPDRPLFGDRVGYYLRTGIHDVTAEDWKFVVDFIRRNRR